MPGRQLHSVLLTMKKRKNRNVIALCSCALCASLSVVIMGIGAAIEVADLTSALLSSLLVWMVQIEFGTKYALSVYTISALLAFLLLPVPFPAFYYTLLFGWYPPFKQQIDTRFRGKKSSILLKAPIVIVVVIIEEILARMVLGYIQNIYITVGIVVISSFLYLPLDILLDRLVILYQKKWRKYIF